ncbi:hypothetical protein Clacol_001265 [Clathrus columnatus]|uniref:LysM domain-containing protein n=1 Tax=Clathrus columnatus TaxID=1419009 RepID=A0AAV4ZXY1_9AGAM|nr:hypothetical protein Clacol_001265 [Clathrus columnatus]
MPVLVTREYSFKNWRNCRYTGKAEGLTDLKDDAAQLTVVQRPVNAVMKLIIMSLRGLTCILVQPTHTSAISHTMPHLNSYLLVAFAFSALTTASPPQKYVRDTAAVPSNVAPGTITSGCTEFHSVSGGETCNTVEAEFNITDAAFRALNPEINSGCTNLMTGLAYCVQATAPPPSTTSTPPVTSPPPPTSTLLPTSTSPPASTPTVPSNVANGTLIDGCTQFFTVPAGSICSEIETQFNISDALLHILNPEINSLCTNLIAGEAYCVANSTSTVPGNVAPGTITAGCTQFFTAQPGDICLTIESTFNISSTLFTTLNPEINAGCTNIIAGLAYCVAGSA